MPKCCLECFGDKFIRAHLLEIGDEGNCEYCGSRRVPTADVGTVGEFVIEGLKRGYALASDEVGPYDHEDGRFMWNDPADASWPVEVMEEEGAFSEILEEHSARERLTGDLFREAASWEDEQDGGCPLGRGEDTLVLRNAFYGEQDTGFDEAWGGFKYRVLYVARFWDHPSHGITRKKLIEPVLAFARLATDTLRAGSTLWRARPVPLSTPFPARARWAAEIGPAPVRMVNRGNRMTPAGISYPYLSDSPATCSAELAYKHPERLWIGEFEVRRDLRILDLTGRARLPGQSVWNPEYEHRLRWGPGLLRGFAQEISRPVRDDDTEIDYVPTQVLAERIRLEGFDGIRFSSAACLEQAPHVHRAQVNYVLFCGHPPEDSDDARLARGEARPQALWEEWLTVRNLCDVKV